MMGDRDFRSVIQNTLASIGRELEVKIDLKDSQTVHLKEVVQCLRRSYYDRTDPRDVGGRGFSELLSGLLRRLQYGSDPKDFDIEEIRLRGHADMITDDIVMLFRARTI